MANGMAARAWPETVRCELACMNACVREVIQRDTESRISFDLVLIGDQCATGASNQVRDLSVDAHDLHEFLHGIDTFRRAKHQGEAGGPASRCRCFAGPLLKLVFLNRAGEVFDDAVLGGFWHG